MVRPESPVDAAIARVTQGNDGRVSLVAAHAAFVTRRAEEACIEHASQPPERKSEGVEACNGASQPPKSKLEGVAPKTYEDASLSRPPARVSDGHAGLEGVDGGNTQVCTNKDQPGDEDLHQQVQAHQLQFMDLCAGAGAMSLAARNMGFNQALALDNSIECVQTLLDNGFANAKHGDLRTYNLTKFKGKVHLMLAGLPCQPFSNAGLKLGEEDERNLWPYLVLAVQTVEPETFMFETVAGFMDQRNANLRDTTEQQLRSLGYTVSMHLVNAKNYGVPQARKRVLVIGHKPLNSDFTAPQPQSLITVDDALRTLGEPDNNNHRRHKVMGCAKEYSKHTASRHDCPAKTLVAGGKGSGGGNNLYCTSEGVVRHFTIREMARLQTFPDDYKFSERWSKAVQQIGNACPVILTQTWITPLARMLVDHYRPRPTSEEPAKAMTCPWHQQLARFNALHAQLSVLIKQLSRTVLQDEATLMGTLEEINKRANELEASPGIHRANALLVRALVEQKDLEKGHTSKKLGMAPHADATIQAVELALEYAQVYDELDEDAQLAETAPQAASKRKARMDAYIASLDARLEPEPELEGHGAAREVPMYFKISRSLNDPEDPVDSEPLYPLHSCIAASSYIRKGVPLRTAMHAILNTEDAKGNLLPLSALFDTGAAVTAVRYAYLVKHLPELLGSIQATRRQFHNASKMQMQVEGTVHMPVYVGGLRLMVLAYVFHDLLEDMLVGQSTLAHHKCSIECATGEVTCRGNPALEPEFRATGVAPTAATAYIEPRGDPSRQLAMDAPECDCWQCSCSPDSVRITTRDGSASLNATAVVSELPHLALSRSLTVPPRSTYTLDPVVRNGEYHQGDFNFEYDPAFLERYGLETVDAVHNNVNRRFACKVRNPTNEAILLPAGVRIATHLPDDDEDYLMCMAVATYDDEDVVRPLDEGGIEDLHKLGFTLENSIDPDNRLPDGSYAPLPDEKKRALYELARRYHYVWSRDAKIPRISHLTVLNIPTGDAAPISQAPYPMPHKLLPHAQAEVEKLLKAGLIEPSMSSWASPMLIRAKKDSTPEDPKVKLVIDYRRLNAVTVEDAGGLGTQADILHYLGGKYKYIGLMDAAGGFYQFLLNPEDRHKSAFILPSAMGGTLFQWRVAPYGLTRNPAGYSRAMQWTLRGLARRTDLAGGTSAGGATSWLDDICIRADSFEGFCNLFELVLGRLLTSGISLKGSKCDLLLAAIDVLGFVATPHGIKLQPPKLKAILGNAAPSTPSEVETFLGMVAFIRRMVPRASLLAAPMLQAKKTCTARARADGQLLTRKGRKGKGAQFNEEEQEAVRQSWQAIIDHLDEDSVVHAPDFEDPNAEFVLVTDASDYAIGGCLMQWQHADKRGPAKPDNYQPNASKDPLDSWRTQAGWKLVIIGYYSKTLVDAQKNYTAFDKEAGAILMCLRHWSDVITYHPTVVYTDSRVALSMLGKYAAPPRLQRWGVEIGTYLPHLRIGHRRGENNGLADLLSRFPAFKSFIKPPQNDVELPDDLFEYTGDAKLYLGPTKYGRDDRRAYLRDAKYELYDYPSGGKLSEHFWSYSNAPSIPGRGSKDRVAEGDDRVPDLQLAELALDALILCFDSAHEASEELGGWARWTNIFCCTYGRRPNIVLHGFGKSHNSLMGDLTDELQLAGGNVVTPQDEVPADVIVSVARESPTLPKGVPLIVLDTDQLMPQDSLDDSIAFIQLRKHTVRARCSFSLPIEEQSRSNARATTIAHLFYYALSDCLRTRFRLGDLDPQDPLTQQLMDAWATQGILGIRGESITTVDEDSLPEFARFVAAFSAMRGAESSEDSELDVGDNADEGRPEDDEDEREVHRPVKGYAWQSHHNSSRPLLTFDPTGSIDAASQRADPSIALMLRTLQSGPSSIRTRILDRYELVNGVVYRRVIKDGEIGRAILVPEHARPAVLALSHYSHATGAGHGAGGKRLYEVIKDHYFWPGMEQECHEFVRACKICASRKSSPSQGAPAGAAPTPTRPFEVIHIDHKGPLPLSQGFRYVLVVVCALTRFTLFVPVMSTTQEATLEALVSRVFSIFGFPLVIVSDNATGFSGEFMRANQHLYGYRNIHIMPHTPCANGLAETAVKKVKTLLNRHTSEYRDWVPLLPMFQLSVNNWITAAVHERPFTNLFGYAPTMLPALENPDLLPQTNPSEVSVYETARRLHRLHARLQQLSDSVKHAAKVKRSGHDPKAVRRIQVGDNVWVKLGSTEDQMRAKKKGYDAWKRPYKVLEVKPHAVLLDVKDTVDILPWQSLRKISLAAPHFHDESMPLPKIDDSNFIIVPSENDPDARHSPTDIATSPTTNEIDDDDPYHGWTENRKYPIERLLSARRCGNGWKVLVKWVGYETPTEEPSHFIPEDIQLQLQLEQCKQDYYDANPERLPVEDRNIELEELDQLPRRRSPRVRGDRPIPGISSLVGLPPAVLAVRPGNTFEIMQVGETRRSLALRREVFHLIGG